MIYDSLKEIKNFLSSDCKETYSLADFIFENALEEFNEIIQKDFSFAKTLIETFDFTGAKKKLVENFENIGDITEQGKENRLFFEEYKTEIKENRPKIVNFSEHLNHLSEYLNHLSLVNEKLEDDEYQKIESLNLYANIVKFENQIEIILQKLQLNIKETIDKLFINKELIQFVEENVTWGFNFIEKSVVIGFEKYTSNSFTKLDYKFFEFVFKFCQPFEEGNLTANIIENVTYLNIKLERELEYKFNQFDSEKSQENYVRLQKIKFDRYNNLLKYFKEKEEDSILSKDLMNYTFDIDDVKKIKQRGEFELDRQIVYLGFYQIVRAYLTAIENVINAYFPSLNLTNAEFNENCNTKVFNKYTWSESKTDLAELVYALAKTEIIKSIKTGKTATKKELLIYFSEQFGEDITDQSLLSNGTGTFKRKDDSKTFTRKLADLFDDYLNSKV